MCALLDDSSMRHHSYDVCSLDGGQPVSDDDAGSSFSCLIQSSLHGLQDKKSLSSASSFCVSWIYDMDVLSNFHLKD